MWLGLFIPGAVHGVEASFLAKGSLLLLRACSQMGFGVRMGFSPTAANAEDACNWPCRVGLWVMLVAILGSLHWPASGADLGVGGVSYAELLILYELWAGERLVLEKAVPCYRRPGRLISVSAVPFGPGYLVFLPFWGSGGFLPCGLGVNHCWLRHVVWEKCGQAPRETCVICPPGVMLLTSSLREVRRQVLCMLPLVMGELEGLERAGRVSDSAEKLQCVLCFRFMVGDQPRLRVWKRLRVGDSAPGADDDAGWRHLHHHHHCEARPAVLDRVGVG